MTDKELAEQYANQSCFTEMANPLLSESIDISDDIKQAFLAGLKAGRPKWHVLQGDIQVLPVVNETVLDENGNQVVYVGHDNWMAYSEYLEAFDEIETPKAWCEIPKFIEE